MKVGLAKGSLTVSENAHVGQLDVSVTTGIMGATSDETAITVNGEVDVLNLTQAASKNTVKLNSHIGSLKLTQGAVSKDPTLPVVYAAENFSVDELNVYPVIGGASKYDETTGRGSDGKISIYALQNPEQKVDDLVLIHGGASGLGNAVWTTSLGRSDERRVGKEC